LHRALQRLEAQRFLLAVTEWFMERPDWKGEFRLESTPSENSARYSLCPDVFDEDTQSLLPHLLTREEARDVKKLLEAFERTSKHGQTSLSSEVAEALNAHNGRPRAIEAVLTEAAHKNGDMGFDPEHLFAYARAAKQASALDARLPRAKNRTQDGSKRRM